MMNQLPEPLSRRRQLKIALRNLRPAYRHYMENHDVDSWSDMEHFGIKYGRRLEKDQNSVEPRPKSKMIIPGAAWNDTSKPTAKVSAARDESESNGQNAEEEPAAASRNGKKKDET